MVSLIVASTDDDASLTLYEGMLRLGGWNDEILSKHGRYRTHHLRDVHILLIDEIHVQADDIDIQHQDEIGVNVDDVLILSRHVSSSNIPAITLHSIGLPGETPHGEAGRSGGIKGKIVPSNPLFAPLFRKMVELATSRGLDSDFDLTLETTHHGPLLSKPTLYVEVGSTEKEWLRADVADVWAETISSVLGLDGSPPQYWDGNGEVMIGVGGGHYAPRHRSVIHENNFWFSHLLANYSLLFDDPVEGELPGGIWQHALEITVDATRRAFPNGDIFAHLDRKSFKGWQRLAIIEKLAELGVPVRRGKELSRR